MKSLWNSSNSLASSALIAETAGPRKQLIRAMPSKKERQVRLPDSTIAFLIFLCVNATLFLRPAELIPELLGLPIYEILILLSLGLSIRRLQWQFRWEALKQQPISLCVVGLLPAVILSHASHAYLWGLKESTILFLKLLVYYGLLVTLIDSPRRLKSFLFTVAVCASAMVAICVVDYVGWHDFEFIKHLDVVDGVDFANQEQIVHRMRGSGIFQDPNDIAMLIVAAGVLCTYFLTDRAAAGLRFAWLLPLGVLAVALLFTRSRGGLLAAGAAVAVFAGIKYGRKVAIPIVLVGIIGATLISGRQGDLSLDEGTGHERITLWREGFQEIKSAEFLFGIGQGEYADMAGLVAHNSYLHALVELGLFGGTLFFGCFFFAGLGMYRLSRPHVRLANPELLRMRPYIMALLAGWCMAMLSLSRCYVTPTFLVIGLCAVYLTMASHRTVPPRLLVRWDQRHRFRLIAASMSTFAAFYVAVKVFT